jgi:DNA polymerase-3 subunit delta
LGNGLEFKALSDHLNTSSLFGGEPVAIVEDAEKITKEHGASLEQLFPMSFGYLIFSAKAKSSLSEMVEKEGIILDLIAEKSWEKEKRIERELEEKVKRRGKFFGPGALFALLSRLDKDIGVLEREVDKLLCYIGDRPSIERLDVEKITSSNRTFTVWQMAEEWIWEGKGQSDESQFHALLPALRKELRLGLKIATLLQKNTPREEWSKTLSKVFPKVLEKRTLQVERMGELYFKRGLLALFDIELRSRTGSTSHGALLDFFRCSIR